MDPPELEPTPDAPVVPREHDSTGKRSSAAPSNPLHEWGAALLIMIILTAFLVFISRYLRGTAL